MPEIDAYIRKYGGCVGSIPQAKTAIWQRYCELNQYCKRNYMKFSDKRLDRHKIAACYMIAIASVRPLFFTEASLNKLENIPAVNETLAITVGCSIISSFAISEIESDKEIYSESEKEALIKIFEGGIILPDEKIVRHGNYFENYANEVRHAIADGNACILSFAHELYLLETYTRTKGQKD